MIETINRQVDLGTSKNFYEGSLCLVTSIARFNFFRQRIERLQGQCRHLHVVLLTSHAAGEEFAPQGVSFLRRGSQEAISRAQLRAFSEHPADYFLAMDELSEQGLDFIEQSLEVLARGEEPDLILAQRKQLPQFSTRRKIQSFLLYTLTRLEDPTTSTFAVSGRSIKRLKKLRPEFNLLALELSVRLRDGKFELISLDAKGVDSANQFLDTYHRFKFVRFWRRLANERFGNLSFFVQFGLVGFSGTVVNIGVLTGFKWLGFSLPVSVAAGIGVSMTTNFLLNRFITFNYARDKNIFKQYFSFVLSSLAGAVINYLVTLQLVALSSFLERVPQIAAVGGILAGMIFNFLANRFWVFRQDRLQ